MAAFIDEHRGVYGVESICRQLPIAPSVYYGFKAREADPDLKPFRFHHDEYLKVEILRVFEESKRRYGSRKIWKQFKNEGKFVPRCTVERLMRNLGIEGVRRGGKKKITTIADEAAERPADLVNRDFTAEKPNTLWVSDLTYVRTRSGFVYAAFVIDAFARRIVGWRVATDLSSNLVLDALNQALYARETTGLTHHSDRGSQYLAIRYSERLARAGVAASVGSRGDSYDNALAETIIGLYKTEVIEHEGPWNGPADVEVATLEWVHWFNHHRLLEPIGDIPPAEFEQAYYQHSQAVA